MKEKDLLVRAAQTLREAHPGGTSGAAATRARILTSAAQRKSQRWRRGLFFTPIVAGLLAGSAWAAQSGRLTAVWQQVTEVLSDTVEVETKRIARAPSHAPVAAAIPLTGELASAEPAHEAVPPLPMPALSVSTGSGSVAEHGSLTVAAPPASASQKTNRVPKRQAVPILDAIPADSSALGSSVEVAPTPPAPDPELAVFRAAHDLHFLRNSPAAAIRAYDVYLTRFPSGRFVPEARYNVALNHLKLGDTTAARRALTPFAKGAWGDYRRTEAKQLLDAMK